MYYEAVLVQSNLLILHVAATALDAVTVARCYQTATASPSFLARPRWTGLTTGHIAQKGSLGFLPAQDAVQQRILAC